MQLQQIILALCLSGFALALPEGHQKNGTADSGTAAAGHHKNAGGKGHQKNGNSENFECKEITKLTKLTSLANNATALSELEQKHNLTAAEISKIKESAANATTRLTKLQSNSTLVTQCVIVDAHEKVVRQCKEITTLTKLTAFANNATAMSELQTKKHLTDAEVTKIKEAAANATTKLTKLQSNTTLVAACSTIKTTGKSNSTSGEISQTSSATSIRSISGSGQILANAIFALFLGGITLSLMT